MEQKKRETLAREIARKQLHVLSAYGIRVSEPAVEAFAKPIEDLIEAIEKDFLNSDLLKYRITHYVMKQVDLHLENWVHEMADPKSPS